MYMYTQHCARTSTYKFAQFTDKVDFMIDSDHSDVMNSCPTLGLIRENDKDSAISLCEIQQVREQVIYASTSSRVDVVLKHRLQNDRDNNAHFLIKYQGTCTASYT